MNTCIKAAQRYKIIHNLQLIILNYFMIFIKLHFMTLLPYATRCVRRYGTLRLGTPPKPFHFTS